MAQRPADRLYYVVTDSSEGDLGPMPARRMRELLEAGSIRADAHVRTGLGTACGTVVEAIAMDEAASDRHPRSASDRRTPRQAPPKKAKDLPRWYPFLAMTVVILGIGWFFWQPGHRVTAVQPAPPIAAPPPSGKSPSSAALTTPSLLKGGDFSSPMKEILARWTKHLDPGGKIEPVANSDGTFLRLTAHDGDAILSQTGTVPGDANALILHYRVRLFSLTSGSQSWNRARVVLLWKNDPDNMHQVLKNFDPSADWQTGELQVPIQRERTEFTLWVGLAKCTGQMDISSISLRRP